MYRSNLSKVLNPCKTNLGVLYEKLMSDIEHHVEYIGGNEGSIVGRWENFKRTGEGVHSGARNYLGRRIVFKSILYVAGNIIRLISLSTTRIKIHDVLA